MRLHYTKALSLVDSNFKEAGDGAFSGYAAVTGNVDLGGDIILKGAFSEWLDKADPGRVRVLWQHDWDKPIVADVPVVNNPAFYREQFEKMRNGE